MSLMDLQAMTGPGVRNQGGGGGGGGKSGASKGCQNTQSNLSVGCPINIGG